MFNNSGNGNNELQAKYDALQAEFLILKHDYMRLQVNATKQEHDMAMLRQANGALKDGLRGVELAVGFAHHKSAIAMAGAECALHSDASHGRERSIATTQQQEN